MAVETIKDPRTRKDTVFITGIIEGVYFNELKNIKTYSGPNGAWTPTHSVNLVVDGTRVNMGITDKDAINSKDVNGSYHKLAKGMDVSVEVSKVGEYNNMPTYDSKASFITVIDASGAVQEQQNTGSGKASYKKRDNTGVVAGNARTAATNWVARFGGSIEDHLETFVTLADKWRKQYAESNASLDDFEVGVTVGQAVLAVSQTVEDAAKFDKAIQHYLDVVVPKSIELVKGNKVESGTAENTAEKPASQPTPDTSDLGDMDDDIPF